MSPRRGLITGYVFKLARESAGFSQEALAEHLAVAPGTIQGWETARRPFTATRVGTAVAIRHRMQRLGADPWLLGALDDAAEADYLIEETIERSARPDSVPAHPLEHLVLTHRLADMIGWAVTGVTPARFAGRSAPARRGPVQRGPRLGDSEKGAFFHGLRVAAEQAAASRAVVLHRQSCYLAGMHPQLGTWLTAVTTTSEYFTKPRPWTPEWADARSVATGLARQGDPQPLRAFIANNTDPTTELAALNYSAYWVGEVGRQSGDAFMVDDSATWRGTGLLRHIVDRLSAGHGFVELNIHTLWSLLLARRGILHDDPAVSRRLSVRATALLDQPRVISGQARRELTQVLYGLRAEGVRG